MNVLPTRTETQMGLIMHCSKSFVAAVYAVKGKHSQRSCVIAQTDRLFPYLFAACMVVVQLGHQV
jgi:hypothetical protein